MNISNHIEFKNNIHQAKYIQFIQYEISFINRIYSYPIEDICIFKDFPHSQLVVLSIHLGQKPKVKCSCTLIWLLQYSHLFLNKNLSEYNIYYNHYIIDTIKDNIWGYNCLSFENISNLFDECGFSRLFKNWPFCLSEYCFSEAETLNF